jgi:hypothetical protein
MKFAACLDELSKHAGLLDAAKKVALTEIPGTKTWFLGGKKPVTDSLKSGVSGTRRAAGAAGPTSTRRTASGAYDVSEMAKKMGLV